MQPRRLQFPILLLLCVGGCASPPPEPEILLTPSQIDGEFLVRQKISGTFHEHTQSFEAALQKQGSTLTVLGLTPYGTKAFSLVQTDAGLTFDNAMPKGRSLPLQPKYLLQDIHHAFFLGPGSKTPELCEEERGNDGVVSRRTFRRRADPDGPAVVVTYTGRVEGAFPKQVRLKNGYYGYTLTIETVSYQPLD